MLQKYFSQSSFKDIWFGTCYRNILARVVLSKLSYRNILVRVVLKIFDLGHVTEIF